MSAWTIAEEEEYILNVLRRYDPKIERLIQRCHHARLQKISADLTGDLTLDSTKARAQGPVFVVRRSGSSRYAIMLLNRKMYGEDPTKSINVWAAMVPLGPLSKMEMSGSELFINCARTQHDYRLVFTEADDVANMEIFCNECKASNKGDLHSLLAMSTGSSTQLTRSLDMSMEVKNDTLTMDWPWLSEEGSSLWKVPDLLSSDFDEAPARPGPKPGAPKTKAAKSSKKQDAKVQKREK